MERPSRQPHSSPQKNLKKEVDMNKQRNKAKETYEEIDQQAREEKIRSMEKYSTEGISKDFFAIMVPWKKVLRAFEEGYVWYSGPTETFDGIILTNPESEEDFEIQIGKKWCLKNRKNKDSSISNEQIQKASDLVSKIELLSKEDIQEIMNSLKEHSGLFEEDDYQLSDDEFTALEKYFSSEE